MPDYTGEFVRGRAGVPGSRRCPTVMDFVTQGAVRNAPSNQPPLQVLHRSKEAPHRRSWPQNHYKQRKYKNAVSYIDQVKCKFSTEPQVFNYFLLLVRNLRKGAIDMPKRIMRVLNFLNGHPELIVGFINFLPPEYKIEVKSDGQVTLTILSRN